MADDFTLPGTLDGAAEGDRRAGEVMEITDQLAKEFAKRNELYRVIDETVYSEYPIRIPESYRKSAVEMRSPLAVHITNTVTAALSVNPSQVTFEPVGRGQSGLDNSSLREHFFEASWQRQEQDSRRQLLRLFLHSIVTKGEGWLKTMERTKRAWSGYNAYSKKLLKELAESDEYPDQKTRDGAYHEKTEAYKQGCAYPIVSTDVPPETVYYWLGEDGFSVVVEDKQVPYLTTLERYGMALDQRGRVVPQAMGLPRSEWQRAMEGTSLLRMIECWTHDRCTYLIAGPGQVKSGNGGNRGTEAKSFKHGYGDRHAKVLRGPYFQALGTTTASRLPEKAGLGVLYGFLSLFPALDNYLTIQSNAAYTFGFPAYKRIAPPGAGLTPSGYGTDAAELQAAVEEVNPGDILPYDVAAIDAPRGGVDLDKVITQVRGFIELALPSVVQGVISGDESGYALNQAAHLARLSWDPLVNNANRALGDRVGWESWLIEHKIAEKVYAWGAQPVPGRGRVRGRRPQKGWLAVGPEDLAGAHRYSVRLDPETPSNRVIEVRTHTEMVKAGFETEADAIEALGGDPGEVERGRMLAAMKKDPVLIKLVRDRILEGIGHGDQEARDRVAGVPQLPGGPAVPGAGPLPGGPPGAPAAGGLGAGAPNVFQPGQNGMPLAPTPAGAVTGVGPAGAGLANAAPRPMTPGPPGRHVPLPGGP